jgi:hypothetical protein
MKLSPSVWRGRGICVFPQSILLMALIVLKAEARPVTSDREQGASARGLAREMSCAALWQGRFEEAKAWRDPLADEGIFDLPPTAQLLTEGGDARIVCGATGVNRYGCSALPDAEVRAYGSSTASTISHAGFAAADALRTRLRDAWEKPADTYERELDRMRGELATLCGVDELAGLEIIFGASGTDLHLFASQLMVDTRLPAPVIVRVESVETGRGVPDALAGRHFSDCAALGDKVIANVPLDCGRPIEICEVKCRTADGSLRPAASVDAEVAEAVARAAAAGRRVLITLVDVSKTGVLAPSPACVAALQDRFPEAVEVLVDACQFRLAPATLKAYLEHDFMVAITGSKFITGPTFCGALFVTAAVAQRMRARALPRALKSYSSRADWPRHWAARDALNPVANYGLLLRWEAALAEMRAFRQLPETAVAGFLATFAQAMTEHLSRSPAFELMPTPVIDRGEFGSPKSWDRIPTIFTFLLRRTASVKPAWLNPDETKKVHELLREDVRHLPGGAHLPTHCQLGQPVNGGTREGAPVHALRLCASSRLIVDALSPMGHGPDAVIADAIATLDKAAFLAAEAI